MIERLDGPNTHICWTPARTVGARVVSLVEEKELVKLETFFRLPLHQQIQKMESATRAELKARGGAYPNGTILLNLADTLKLAHNLAFQYFTKDLTVEYVL